ncbi:hypothetical protein FRB99_007769 [Tulasnella sp. 403]|nr:hypothetical protein FRB99_007769 [Tulasnella sp. 403]
MGRRTTIYDVADLRVHQDGTRVSSKSRHRIVTDGHGNIIAADAVGNTKPPRKVSGRKRKRSEDLRDEKGKGKLVDIEGADSLSEREEIDISLSATAENDSLLQNALPSGPSGRNVHKTAPITPKDPKAKRRIAFREEVLIPSTQSRDNTLAQLPESDFLKTIHYYASKYYESRGALINAPSRKLPAHKREKQEDIASPDKVDPPHPESQTVTRDMCRALRGVVLQEDLYFQMQSSKPPPPNGA